MSSAGDDIRRTLVMEPKVREAIAEIADAVPEMGYIIEGGLTANAAAQDYQAKNLPGLAKLARENVISPAETIAEAVDGKPGHMEKQVAAIVASQGLTPADVHQILSQIDAGDKKQPNTTIAGFWGMGRTTSEQQQKEGRRLECIARGKLESALEGGINDALRVTLPLKTPQATNKKQGREGQNL